MTGSTIATSVDHSVTLGSASYPSPLSITATGIIDGSAAEAALYVPVLSKQGIVRNDGAILGSVGGISGTIGLPGADGILLSGAANIINNGEIIGGKGGASSQFRYGAGGIGIDIATAGVTVRNNAMITGGNGGGNDGGDGGIGVRLVAGSKLNNAGTISGGIGSEGVGVSDVSGQLINTGSISGGMTSFYGGAGVYISGAGATGRNSGQITGGSANEFTNYTYGYGLHATNGAVFHNSGTIIGGKQTTGVVISDATMVNTGLIQGGYNSGLPTGLQGYYLPYFTGLIFDGGRLVNHGTIVGGNAGYRQLYGNSAGIGVEAAASFTNLGLIAGGTGGGYYGGDGGTGVSVDLGMRNDGTIAGGKGGKASASNGAGYGGAGLEGGNGTFVNHGIIRGGSGGGGGDYGGRGGGGAYLTSALLINTGRISGGKGNASELRDYLRPNGGTGGLGVSMRTGTIDNTGKIIGGNGSDGGKYAGAIGAAGVVASNSTIINQGAITGGNGGGGSTGAKGGDGVDLLGGTLLNGGTITGGAGGIGTGSTGAAGDAVSLSSHSTLIIEPSAVFNGLVVATSGGADTLEVAGTSATALAGIGQEFTNFATFAFAADAAWTLSGTTQALATGQTITGFTSQDAIGLTNAAAASGSVTVATAGTVTVDAGGTDYNVDIAGAMVGETGFRFADYKLTESGTAMTFLVHPLPAAEAGAPSLAALFAAPAQHADFFSGTATPSAAFPTFNLPGAFDDALRDWQSFIPPTITLHA